MTSAPPSTHFQAPRSLASRLLWPAAIIGVAAPLVVLAAAAGSDIGWFGLDFALGVLIQGWALWIAAAGLVAGLVLSALSLSRLSSVWPLMAVAVLVPATTLAGVLWGLSRADARPPVHETATDWTDPLTFSPQTLAARGPGAWPVQADPVIPADIGSVRAAWAPYAGRRVAEVSTEACPGAVTVPRLAPTAAVIRALEAEGVRVIGESPWRVEGVQESAWFGRVRDVTVRMRPGATDLRVSERIGRSDLGQTCDLAARLAQRLRASA